MRHFLIYSLSLAIVGWVGSAQGLSAQVPSKDAAPKANNTPADRAPRDGDRDGDRPTRDGDRNADRPQRDSDELPGFPPRDGRPPAAGQSGRPPQGPPFRRGGEPPRPGFPGGLPGDLGPQGPGQFDLGRGPGAAARLEELKKYDPEMYELEQKDMELEQQSFDLSQQYRRAPRDQRESLKTQLQEVVQKHFDARQARRQLQLKRLEEELNRMRTAMEKRTESRVQIVERRMVELVGERSDFDF